MAANSFFDPRPFDLAAEIVHEITDRDPTRRHRQRQRADLDLLLLAAEVERAYDRDKADTGFFWADLARSDRLRHLRHLPRLAMIEPVGRVLRSDDQLAVEALRVLGGRSALDRVRRLAWGLPLADSSIAEAAR